MEWEIREQCNRRYDMLVSHYNYLLEQENQFLLFTLKNGWFNEKYNVLFSLNSFYQIVIGPLVSSGRISNTIGLGSEIPIVYGNSIKFDSYHCYQTQKIYREYILSIHKIDSSFKEWWLSLNKTDDIVFYVYKSIKENEQGGLD